MVHPYIEEQALRIAYVNEAAVGLGEHLRQFKDAERTARLGTAALAMDNAVRSVYCPEVSEEGIVTLSFHQVHDDAIPVLALRPDETLTRDMRFGTFTPRQLELGGNIPMHTISGRLADGVREPRSVALKGHIGKSSARRFVYEPGDTLAPGQKTFFNLRPIAVLDYREDCKPVVAMRQLTCALRHAICIVENPVVTLPEEGQLIDTDRAWRAESQEVATRVMRTYKG